MNERIRALEKAYIKEGRPDFRAGDTVRVFVRIREDEKTRIQPYEGLVIARKGGSIRETFTVRRMSFGEGVERTFPLHSPSIEKILVIKRGHVRRAKLYYLRKKIGKGARIEQRVEEKPQAPPSTTPPSTTPPAPVSQTSS